MIDNVTIIGAGLTGLSAAFHLKEAGIGYRVFEKESEPGGMCRSVYERGFTFDYTGHLLHIHEKDILRWVKRVLKGKLNTRHRKAFIYSFGRLTPYPFQVHTHGLPPRIVDDCVCGFIEAYCKRMKQREVGIENFYQWILYYFGRGVAKHFMVPYNRKLWTLHPRNLTRDWLGNYVPSPSLREVLHGAAGLEKKEYGYNVHFYYPEQGGIQCLVNAIASKLEHLYCRHTLYRIDLKRRAIYFSNGEKKYYEFLLSTIPLPELIYSCLDQIPPGIREAAEKLKCSSVFNINLGIDRPLISSFHWIYFPEKEFIFYRVGFPENFSRRMVPSEKSSLYVEVGYSPWRPLPPNIRKRVRQGLIKAGILRTSREIVCENILDLKYAYVTYDRHRNAAVSAIQDFLQSKNIYSGGRYGAWEYSTMEDAMACGRRFVERLKRGLNAG